MNKIKLIAVVGPTASGKTALSIQIARQFNGEILSADSMQIYKGMPIASAVPVVEEQGGITHYFIEMLEPTQRFTVADYVQQAHQVAADIHSRGKTPILVGGTGLYVDSFLGNVHFSEEKAAPAVRTALRAEIEENGMNALYHRLHTIDPQTAARLHPNDHKRIIRALEVYALTGKTLTEQNKTSRLAESPYAPTVIGLRFTDRQKLYDRINRRVDAMVAAGLLEEARVSYARCAQYPTAYAAIGHKELYGYFSGKLTLDQAVENLKQATRRYAKRQMTWFRRNPDIRWIDVDGAADVYAAAMDILKDF